jgi:hypothetical protein
MNQYVFNLQEIADVIWDYEWNQNGLCNLSGTDIRVENVRVDLGSENVFCDVVFDMYDDPDARRVERYSDCRYSFKVLGLELNG